MSTENIYYVYFHRKKTDNKVFYIGKGKNRRAYWANSRNKHWTYTAKKHGFTVDIVKNNMSEREAFDLEVKLIKEYGLDNLCNYTNGGDGPSGKHHTEKFKEHMRKIHTGRKFSDETIEKMRVAAIKRCAQPGYQEKRTSKLRGRKHTEDHKRKISEAGKGRLTSKESRKKISDYHKGKKKKPEAVRCMALSKMKNVRCINNNTVYESITKASKELGFSASSISRCANGDQKSTKGFRFEFVENDNTQGLPKTGD